MRVKIVSEHGHPQTTYVVNQETGERLEGVVSIEWHVGGHVRALAVLTLVDVPVDVVADEVEVHGPSHASTP